MLHFVYELKELGRILEQPKADKFSPSTIKERVLAAHEKSGLLDTLGRVNQMGILDEQKKDLLKMLGLNPTPPSLREKLGQRPEAASLGALTGLFFEISNEIKGGHGFFTTLTAPIDELVKHIPYLYDYLNFYADWTGSWFKSPATIERPMTLLAASCEVS